MTIGLGRTIVVLGIKVLKLASTIDFPLGFNVIFDLERKPMYLPLAEEILFVFKVS